MADAGWWQDPTGMHELRYFDGNEWTAHVSDQGAPSQDPVIAPPPPVAVPPTPTLPVASPTIPTPAAPAPAPSQSGAFPAAPTAKKPVWKRWWFLGGAAIIVLIVIAAAVSAPAEDDPSAVPSDPSDEQSGAPDEGSTVDGTEESPGESDDSAAVTTPDESNDQSEPQTAEPASSDEGDATDDDSNADSGDPDADDGPVPVGIAVTEDDDIVRVNAVMADVPPTEFFDPDPGTTITGVEVEACAGDDGFNANPLYWTAFLDDNTAAENYLFADDFEAVSLKPGACIRGIVTFTVPDGRTVSSVVLTGQLFEETARWLVEGAVPVTERLQPVQPVEAAALGESVTFGAGHSAVVRSVVDNSAPLSEFFGPETGRQFSQIDVELCAGSESLAVNPLYWLGATAERWMGSAALGGSTLNAIDLASGQCIAGLVEIDLPEGSTTEYIVLMNAIFDEAARWVTS